VNKAIIMGAFLLLCCYGCYPPKPRDEPKSKPSPEEMFGTYQVSEESKLPKGYKAEGTLCLKSNMTFSIEDMMGWGEKNSRLGYERNWSGSGTWEVVKNPSSTIIISHYILVLRFEELNIIRLYPEIGKTKPFVPISDFRPNIAGQYPPYHIIILISTDPDDDYFLKLEKTSQNAVKAD